MSINLRPLFTASLALFAAGLAAQTSRSGSYSKSIGNMYLGGAVFAHGSVSTSSTLFRRTGDARVYLRADGAVLTHQRMALELDMNAHNETTLQSIGGGSGQSARASFRLMLAGIEVANRSVTTTGDLGGIPERTYNLSPTDLTADIYITLGVSLRLAGNAGVRFGAGANVILPTTVAEVRPTVSSNAAVVARARLALVLSVLGYAVAQAGFELHGTFAETRVMGSLVASATNGLSGFVNFKMRAISLLLQVYGQILGFRRTREVTNWSFGSIDQDILSI